MNGILETTVDKNIAEIDAEVKEAVTQSKRETRSRIDDRVAKIIAKKGFTAAYSEMMSSSRRIGMMEAQAWGRAAARQR